MSWMCRYIDFWTSAIFFCVPALVEAALVSRFARRMVQRSLSQARMPCAEVEALWDEVVARVDHARTSGCENYAALQLPKKRQRRGSAGQQLRRRKQHASSTGSLTDLHRLRNNSSTSSIINARTMGVAVDDVVSDVHVALAGEDEADDDDAAAERVRVVGWV
jgi:hypothetical protein